MPSRMPRLVLVSGPSCVGKSPLKQALDHEFPELARTFRVPVLFHSRSPRPGERDGVDYHFRSREESLASRQRVVHEAAENAAHQPQEQTQAKSPRQCGQEHPGCCSKAQRGRGFSSAHSLQNSLGDAAGCRFSHVARELLPNCA